MFPAYTWARWKSKRNLELLPPSLVFIKSLYALVQLAVPAKSCKSCCVPDHKLGWDGSAVWWGLHNTHTPYIWLKALLLIPHFHEHKINFLFFLLLWRTHPVAWHKQQSFSRQNTILWGVIQWSKIISGMVVHFPITQCHWKMQWVLAWTFLLLSNSHCTSCQLLTSAMIEILTHVKKQDSYRIFVNLYYFALWSFF